MVRPALQGHGGDVELVSVEEDKTVKVRLQGACQGCPGAAMTMKMGIERILKEKVPELTVRTPSEPVPRFMSRKRAWPPSTEISRESCEVSASSSKG